MSSVRGVHIPGASGAVDETRKPAKPTAPKLAEKKSGGKGGKPQTARPFPGAAAPFKKGGKRR